MKSRKKRKAIPLLAFIADVSCLTNRSFYMRTLSLKHKFLSQNNFNICSVTLVDWARINKKNP